MFDLLVVVDLGKSLVKAIWSQPTIKEKQLILLEPEIVFLTSEDTATIQRENADPEKDAWLLFPDGSGEALGFVTQTPRYSNRKDVGRGKLKQVHGVSRCLAVLGAIAERAELTKPQAETTELSVALSVLVPLSEWSTRKEFRQDLLNALSEFNFRGRQYQVKVELLDIKPEGLGLLMRRQLQLLPAIYRSKSIACLIMGHYNTTLYLYQGGQKIVDECSSRGFYQLVDKVIAETSLDESDAASHDLTEAIYDARSNPAKIRALLWRKVGSETKLQQQIEQVQVAIEKASTDYWKSLTQRINNSLGAHRFHLSEVLVSGGASRFFKAEIEQFFAGTDVLWSCQLNYLVGRDCNLKAEDAMAFRLADAYSVHDWLQEASNQPQVEAIAGATHGQ
jgi:hypothetical protein